MKRVVVTGLGPLSSLGKGCDETWDSIGSQMLNLVKEKYAIGGESWGEFFLHKMRNFDINDYDLPSQNFNFIKELRTVKNEDTDLYYLLAVIKLALNDGGLKYDTKDNEVGLVLTHENPGVEIFFEELVESLYPVLVKGVDRDITRLKLAKTLYENGCEERGYNLQSFSYLFSAAKVFDFHGYSLFINNACASGLFAIDSAARQIRDGTCKAVVVAGADNPTKIYKYLWFKKKGLYAEDGLTKPFSEDANGIVFGDGGAALLLEDLEEAKRRKANIYAEYLGGGFSLEGWKIAVPDITGVFYEKSFRRALKVSGVGPDEIDFINPHGVGMKVTDTYEAATINRVFSGRKPKISAFKPLCGHNLGGSALLETVISLLALKNGMIPGTLNCKNVNKELKLDIVKENMPEEMKVIAKMSCGFAGFNGVGIFRKLV